MAFCAWAPAAKVSEPMAIASAGTRRVRFWFFTMRPLVCRVAHALKRPINSGGIETLFVRLKATCRCGGEGFVGNVLYTRVFKCGDKPWHGPVAGNAVTIKGMTSLVRYAAGSRPLVLDSPHSGTAYPADFVYACDLALLRCAEDTHVEKLYDFALGLGVHWIEAHFPRSYLDANRNITEMDVTLLDAPWPEEVETDPKLTKVYSSQDTFKQRQGIFV